jgi:chemotaxis protein CheD
VKIIVGVADMKTSANRGDEIVTHALGSCLGITIYDSVACIGGMLHVMLPNSAIDPPKAEQNPYVFMDTGLPRLFHECYKLGAQKQRLEVKVAGGACASGKDEADDFFQIGKRNFLMFRQMLWKNGVILKAQDVGSTISRTMTLEIGTGKVSIRANGQISFL